jgi:hypothetical protein
MVKHFYSGEDEEKKKNKTDKCTQFFPFLCLGLTLVICSEKLWDKHQGWVLSLI